MPLETFRGGWKPTPESVPRPRFDAALRMMTVPASVDFYSSVPAVGMHLNDSLGCCTCSCDANIVQGVTCYGQGTEFVVPDNDVLLAYEQSGYQPGNPSTDNGWTCAAALDYLKSTGMSGHKIADYGQVSYTDHNKVMVCVSEFGYASVGVNLPQSAMDQFNAGGSPMPTWSVSGDSTIIGGHCICLCGYTPAGPVIWTWGSPVQCTWQWWDTYVSECWPVVSQEWVNAASLRDPEGVNLSVLGQEFQAAVGHNPFPPGPGPSPSPPGPTPPPVPSPSPSGCLPFSALVKRLAAG